MRDAPFDDAAAGLRAYVEELEDCVFFAVDPSGREFDGPFSVRADAVDACQRWEFEQMEQFWEREVASAEWDRWAT